nr:MAG TPA: hypothetical protein [Caudoviricetes sp.]
MKNLTLHTFKLKYTKTVGKQGHERMKKNAEYRRNEKFNTAHFQA